MTPREEAEMAREISESELSFEEVKKEINKTNQDSIIKKNIKPIE